MKDNYSRKLPAARSQEPGFVKLTSKQWSVYYWLVTKAYWNSDKREQHYFIYRDSVNFCEMRQDLGIKDNRTIRNALEKLEEVGKICMMQEIIYIPHPDLYTYLSIDVLKYLLNLCAVTGLSNELVVLYSILKRLKELDLKNKQQSTFTLKLLVKLLGRNETDAKAYYLARAFVSLLAGEGLITITQTSKMNRGGRYIEYTLWDIKEKLDDNFCLDFDGEKIVEL